MRIALISFEYPPAVAIGGIAAYAFEAARMLVSASVEVEVFAAGRERESVLSVDGVLVHRVVAADRASFREEVLPLFSARHELLPFDVFESPEVGAEGLRIAESFPELPMVVKLHTPSYLIGQLSYEPPDLCTKLRFTLGALRRGRFDKLAEPDYVEQNDPEVKLARLASWIAAPSQAIANRVGTDWGLPGERMTTFPYPYSPPNSLLSLPPPKVIRTIGFLGRLEPRKGVVELTKAIPKILEVRPYVRFRMLGPSWPYRRSDMQNWMKRTLGKHISAVEFVGEVNRDDLATELSKCDAVILPSRWESFGYVCLEAMAAARLVVGSTSGGMRDFIHDGQDGRLVPPYAPSEIVRILIEAVDDPVGSIQMAASGRSRVRTMLSPDKVLPQQILCYENAIASHAKTKAGTVEKYG